MNALRDRTFVLLLFCIFAAVVIRTAWLSDDAAITLRVVLNFAHGYGAVYNPVERVQAFTHPLWFLLLAAAHALAGNIYWVALLLSIALSLWAFWYVGARLATSAEGALLAALALIGSRAFVDYSTSGLENPLAYLLLAWFVREFATPAGAPQRALGRLSFLAALIYLTRPDLALMVAPLWLIACYRTRSLRQIVWQSAWGATPAVLWTAFALVYYGFPFPNTAYAKLGNGVPGDALLAQGFYYALDSLNRDPLTLTVIAVVLVGGWRTGEPLLRGLALGILLYGVYVLSIGGDFMTGRFFAVPLFGAAVMLARLPTRAGPAVALPALALLALALAAPHPTLLSDASFADEKLNRAGIADERGFAFPEGGLLTGHRDRFREPEWLIGRSAPDIVEVRVICGGLGATGLTRGPWTHLVDNCGLSDPLLARLPPKVNPYWRIGHFEREVPEGYLESVRTDQNLLMDPALKQYYDALRLITRGPLFTPERFAAIAAMNLGQYDHLIDRARYGAPAPPLAVGAAEVAEPKAEGSRWNAPGNIVFRRSVPLTVTFDGLQVNRAELDISLDGNDQYRVTFLRDGRSTGSLPLGPRRGPGDGLARYVLPLPKSVAAAGFDAIRVSVDEGDDAFSLGHLIVR